MDVFLIIVFILQFILSFAKRMKEEGFFQMSIDHGRKDNLDGYKIPCNDLDFSKRYSALKACSFVSSTNHVEDVPHAVE